jgi:hypothetical protein
VRDSCISPNSKVIIYGENYSSYHVAISDKNGFFIIPYKSDAGAKFRIKLIDNEGTFEYPNSFTSTTFTQSLTLDLNQSSHE